MSMSSRSAHARGQRAPAFAALALLLGAFALPAHALRCGTRVVDEGDRDFAVRERCGEPYYTEQSYALTVRGANSTHEVQDETVYDVWYYNFGPQRLLVRLLFRDGRLAREETLGYGVNDIGSDCNLDGLSAGTPAGEIVARCGTPASRSTRQRTEVRRDGRGNERFTQVRLEEWVYDIGRNRLMRVLTLENGRLREVNSESR
jgi:hypothetical protein